MSDQPDNNSTVQRPTLLQTGDLPHETLLRRPDGNTPQGAVTQGTIVDGRYCLEQILGGGGMGVVYRARDALMEEQHDPDPFVALKVIADSIRDVPDAALALQRECKRAQRLSHPNIVRVFHFGKHAESHYYLTMELLEGRSLEGLMKQYPEGLPWREAAPFIRQMCSAIGYAHSEGIVHSDLKPGNVFVTQQGAIKVLDFGIAAPLRRQDSGGGETRFDPRKMGAHSPMYSPVEMQMGAAADVRDDVFSIACVIYQLLSGRHPFENQPIVKAVELRAKPKAIAQLSGKQNQALQAALAMWRADRTESIAKLEAELFASSQPVSRTKVALVVGVASVAAVAVLATLFLRPKSTKEAEPAQPILVATPNSEPLIDGVRATELLAKLGISTPLALDSDKRVSRAALLATVAGSPRRVSLGSTESQIDAAVALCGKSSQLCSRQQFADEALRVVNLTAYILDVGLVTVAEFQRYVERTKYRTGAEISGVAYSERNGSLIPVAGGNWRNAVGVNRLQQGAAVVGVSFDDALSYCREQGKRLPTEDEWEYAARGPGGNIFPWGNEPQAALRARATQPLAADGVPEGIAGRYRGFAGNVWQWVDTEVDGRKLLKGGSWRDANAANKRPALRAYEVASHAHDNTGFRCAQSDKSWPDAPYWVDQLNSK